MEGISTAEKSPFTYTTSTGREITHYPDGGISVKVPEDDDDKGLAGKTFHRWSNSSYVAEDGTICKEGQVIEPQS
jgi:hypothetical protein